MTRQTPPPTIRPQPCIACPYRRDVASGVWEVNEYLKLPPYDAETFGQPLEAFACHAMPEALCHGWAVVHSNRGHDHELLALRFAPPAGPVPTPTVPLFSSGAEAAMHGLRSIRRPGKKAREMMARLKAAYPRLRDTPPPPETPR